MSLNQTQRGISLRLGVLGTLVLLFCLGVTAVGILALVTEDDTTTGAGNAIVYGLTLNPSGFDPHIFSSSELGIPFYSVYDTLIYRHPQTMDFVPGLAERWEMAADGLSWTFYLRQGVTFHDGEPFNAQAVATNLDRITNPENGSRKAALLLGTYTGYTIVDAYTITLNLSEPYSPLLDGLSQVYTGIASPKALAEYTKNSYQWHQVGTGPYMLDEVVPGERLVLKRNPDYAWGPVFYAPQTAETLDTIEFRFYEDAATRSQALESGAVQMIGELLPTDAELLIGNPAVKIVRVPIAGMPQQFFFNTTQTLTDNAVVRQALIYATNRTAIADSVFQGQSPVAYGPLTSVTPFYDEAVAQLYPYDPEYARGLLESVGYTDADEDGILDLDGVPLELTMVFAPWNQMSAVAQLIQSQWSEIGISLELVYAPDFASLSDHVARGDYHLIAFYDFSVDASVLNPFYLSTGANNWSGYADEELDNWLREAVRQQDNEIRASLYKSVQERIMEQAVILPITEYVNLNGTTARLDGVIFSAQGWWPLLRNVQLTG